MSGKNKGDTIIVKYEEIPERLEIDSNFQGFFLFNSYVKFL